MDSVDSRSDVPKMQGVSEDLSDSIFGMIRMICVALLIEIRRCWGKLEESKEVEGRDERSSEALEMAGESFTRLCYSPCLVVHDHVT